MTASVLPDHARALDVLRPLCARFPLALAGAEALRAHGIVVGPPDDLVLAVPAGPADLGTVAAAVVDALRTAGHPARCDLGTPRSVRISAGPCPIDLRREPLRHPPVLPATASFPVVDLPDAAALTVLELCDRGLPADLVAVYRLGCLFSQGELTALAAAFDEDFQTSTLADRLETAAALWEADETVPRWAEAWAQDLRLDQLEAREEEDGLHDPYLESGEEEPDDL